MNFDAIEKALDYDNSSLRGSSGAMEVEQLSTLSKRPGAACTSAAIHQPTYHIGDQITSLIVNGNHHSVRLGSPPRIVADFE